MSIDTSALKNWIRENPEKAPSAKVVAALHHISVNSLHKEFHRREGITIGAFIDDIRLEEVKRLLLTTDRLCFEIAIELTIGREDVLARWFKHRTGLTMEEFRRKKSKAPNSTGGESKRK
jgi:AraC-like DNA-binding protein